MPLRPSEQIQSISVISEKSITEQGALTVTDVAEMYGVTLFGSYGGVRKACPSADTGSTYFKMESDGVRFRTGSALSEMQG